MSDLIEFIDKDRDVSMRYYDLCDSDNKTKKKGMKQLIKEDPYFLDSYCQLYHVLLDEGKEKEAKKVIDKAYENALSLILDKNNKWPDLLEWGWIENRHIIRAILNKGIFEWELGNDKDALEIFRKLLKTNTNDNAGVRFYILAILMGMSFEDYENKFNKDGYYDIDSWKWFDKNHKKFEEEFSVIKSL